MRISILDLWGISFHAVVVFSLGKDLLFKSILGHCVIFAYTPDYFVVCCHGFFHTYLFFAAAAVIIKFLMMSSKR